MALGLNSANGKISQTADLGGHQSVSVGDDLIGQLLYDTGTVSLSSTFSNPTIPNSIVAYNGKGITHLHGTLTVVDTPGGTTAPSGVTSVQSVIKQLQFTSVNGKVGEPLMNMDGSLNEITNWQRILNPNGNYQTAPTPTITASGAVTTTWDFDIYYDIPTSLFNLKPALSFNTEGSRATTLNGMTSTARLELYADFKSIDVYGNPLYASRLKNIPISDSATGVVQYGTNMDTNVTAYQQAYDFGADSNLSSSNTFNFSLSGQQILNNMPYVVVSSSEANIYPLGSHISGFFPIKPVDSKIRNYNASYNFSANIASAPYVGDGVNQLTNKVMAYVQEAV
jgi:hypothetical protein